MIAAISARILLAVLCLLACATAASAECAWVLWDTTMALYPNVGPAVYTVDSAYGTQPACEAVAREKASRPWNSRQETLVWFVCLPDTVDPRGPKGTK